MDVLWSWFPGGQDVFVPWAERLHYVEMIQEYRLKSGMLRWMLFVSVLDECKCRPRTLNPNPTSFLEAVYAIRVEGDCGRKS